MAIQTQSDKLLVLADIFQARYQDGFTLLDRRGVLVNRIRATSPEWSVTNVMPDRISLQLEKANVVANIGVEAIDLSLKSLASGNKPSLAGVEQQHARLAAEAQALYELTVEVLGVPRTLRVGSRAAFLAPADSLEESDRVVYAQIASPFSKQAAEGTNVDLVDGSGHWVFEDRKTGVRRTVRLQSVVTEQPAGAPPVLGFPEVIGSGGLFIDIDEYTRPDEGHFSGLKNHLQGAFLRSRDTALKLLSWAVNPRR